MSERKFYLAIIPARAGSKRIPGKNLVPLAGKPLLDYTLDAARGSQRLDATAISTDSVEIAAHARARGVLVPAMRPAELAGDASPVVAALQHTVAAFERSGPRVDAVVLLQPTSPFRRATDIDRAIELFERSGADTVTAVRPTRDHPYWAWRERAGLIEPYRSHAEMATDRQALPPVYAETGAVYVTRRELVGSGCIYGSRIVPYLMEERACVDVDTPLDLAWAEFLFARAAAGAPDDEA